MIQTVYKFPNNSLFFRSLNSGGGMGGGGMSRFGNQTYGLSPQFLDSLGIDGPLHNRLFVANLAYSVDEKKLREVFRLAGRVVTAELNRDKVRYPSTKRCNSQFKLEYTLIPINTI